MNPPDGPHAATPQSPALNSALPRTPSRGLAAQLTAAGLFVAGYVGLEWVSFVHEHKGLPVTPWNPGTGAALALMILGGPRYGVALFVGIALAEIVLLQSDLEWPAILGIAATISAGYAIVADVARRRLLLDVGLPHLRDVFVLLGAAIAGATLVSLLSLLTLLAIGRLDDVDVILASATFVVGDLIGIAVMTPLLLRLAARWREGRVREFLPATADLLLLGVVIAVALGIVAATETDDGSKFFYLLFFPVVIAAVRHGLDGACLGLAVTQLGLVGLLHLHGYEASIFTGFQMLMFVLTATGLTVGAVVSERRAADHAVRDAEARLREKEVEAAQAARFTLVRSMASALAHEINQPLTAIRALARSIQHLLRTPDGDAARADRNLTTMIAHVDHIGAVVGHMRDFLRRGRPHVSTISVGKMLDDALLLVRPMATTHHVRIELDVPDDLPPLHGDRIQLEQVVINLLRNAVEAISDTGAADGRIRLVVRAFKSPARIEIAVADNGPGIDAEVAERLFNPLTTSKKEGLGLGLPICASIIESHGGRIWLASGGPGGAEFRFSLPLDNR